MHKIVTTVALFGTLVCGLVAAAPATQGKKVAFVDSAKGEFKPLAPGASVLLVTGDLDKGPFSAFVKFDAGAKFEMHSHSSDLRMAVIKGAYLYKGANGEEHRAGTGCFLSTPGGDHHWSGGDEKEGALFYIESNGKFDLIPDKK
jgi:anti-sigma factor ChrR (cupin superfamily)